VGDCRDLAATDATFDRGPALSALFEAALLPSAEIERAPTSTHEDDPFEGFAPHARVAGPVGQWEKSGVMIRKVSRGGWLGRAGDDVKQTTAGPSTRCARSG